MSFDGSSSSGSSGAVEERPGDMALLDTAVGSDDMSVVSDISDRSGDRLDDMLFQLSKAIDIVEVAGITNGYGDLATMAKAQQQDAAPLFLPTIQSSQDLLFVESTSFHDSDSPVVSSSILDSLHAMGSVFREEHDGGGLPRNNDGRKPKNDAWSSRQQSHFSVSRGRSPIKKAFPRDAQSISASVSGTSIKSTSSGISTRSLRSLAKPVNAVRRFMFQSRRRTSATPQ
jgi:hypothetical protein